MFDVLERLQQAAETLPGILNKLVFVGGGVTEILITDSAGRNPRPTKDLDCIVEVASRFQYYKIEEYLRSAGYSHDQSFPPTICRWVKGSLILDVMPTIEGILGFTNKWYGCAIDEPMIHKLPSQMEVNIIRVGPIQKNVSIKYLVGIRQAWPAGTWLSLLES